MIPLRDRNPTSRAAVVTWLIIGVCVVIFVLVQQPAGGVDVVRDESGRSVQIDGDVRFNYEWAAIPCEVVEGRPLTVDEVAATVNGGDAEACVADSTRPRLFPGKQVWLALLTSMFLHGSWLHLGGNMLYLWVFGNNIEDHLGRARFVVFYLAAGLVASVAHIAVQPSSTVPVVGASGAIAGVMGAYLVWFPRARVQTLVFMLLVFFTEVSAGWLLGIWFVLQFFTAPGSSVAWVAHVAGFVFGVLVGALVKASAAARRALWRQDPRWSGNDPWYR